MKFRVDINCDMGEGYGHFTVGNDAEIMPYITSANVACGFHAGEPLTIAQTIALAKSTGSCWRSPGIPRPHGFWKKRNETHI